MRIGYVAALVVCRAARHLPIRSGSASKRCSRLSIAAAQAAKHAYSTVVTALGKIWLFTIGNNASEPSRGGVRMATVGPLVVKPGEKYVAQYMEGITTPGTTTPVHRHPGPEAWYTLAGQACIETPAGKSVAHAGE